MNEIDKEKILRFISECCDFEKLSTSVLQRNLARKNLKVSIPTINKYKSMLIQKKKDFYNTIGYNPDSYDEIITQILNELSRNRKKIEHTLNYRKRVRYELEKFKSEQMLNKNSNYEYNNKLKKLKKDTFKKINDIPIKTLNYLYNDEAKKLNLLPRRSIIDTRLITEICSQFENGTIQNVVLEKCDSKASIRLIIQDYIIENYKTEFSLSMIQRYFHKYFSNLYLVMYRKIFLGELPNE